MTRARPSPLLPAEQRPALVRRLAIVLTVALLIGGVNWALQPAQGPGRRGIDVAMVYAFAISGLTWLFIDVGRFVLRGPLRAGPPGYWPAPLGAGVLILVGIAAGYLGGTTIGDAYAGGSTWTMWQNNPNRFTGILVSSVAISIAFVALFHERGRRESAARRAQEAELRLLQSQLEPHMLFNTLANLRVLIGIDPPRAQAMLDRLIAFLRATLDASRSDRHTLAAEFDRLADYLALMQVRMGPRLEVVLDLPAELRARAVPPLLLQPLVENAVKHGLEPKVEGGRVEVVARRDGAQLLLSVHDTGVGVAEVSPATGGGFGLQQVRERLHTLYGDAARVDLGPDAAGGTLARIVLPLPA